MSQYSINYHDFLDVRWLPITDSADRRIMLFQPSESSSVPHTLAVTLWKEHALTTLVITETDSFTYILNSMGALFSSTGRLVSDLDRGAVYLSKRAFSEVMRSTMEADRVAALGGIRATLWIDPGCPSSAIAHSLAGFDYPGLKYVRLVSPALGFSFNVPTGDYGSLLDSLCANDETRQIKIEVRRSIMSSVPSRLLSQVECSVYYLDNPREVEFITDLNHLWTNRFWADKIPGHWIQFALDSDIPFSDFCRLVQPVAEELNGMITFRHPLEVGSSEKRIIGPIFRSRIEAQESRNPFR
jgi:hypothetical protein